MVCQCTAYRCMERLRWLYKCSARVIFVESESHAFRVRVTKNFSSRVITWSNRVTSSYWFASSSQCRVEQNQTFFLRCFISKHKLLHPSLFQIVVIWLLTIKTLERYKFESYINNLGGKNVNFFDNLFPFECFIQAHGPYYRGWSNNTRTQKLLVRSHYRVMCHWLVTEPSHYRAISWFVQAILKNAKYSDSLKLLDLLIVIKNVVLFLIRKNLIVRTEFS